MFLSCSGLLKGRKLQRKPLLIVFLPEKLPCSLESSFLGTSHLCQKHSYCGRKLNEYVCLTDVQACQFHFFHIFPVGFFQIFFCSQLFEKGCLKRLVDQNEVVSLMAQNDQKLQILFLFVGSCDASKLRCPPSNSSDVFFVLRSLIDINNCSVTAPLLLCFRHNCFTLSFWNFWSIALVKPFCWNLCLS